MHALWVKYQQVEERYWQIKVNLPTFTSLKLISIPPHHGCLYSCQSAFPKESVQGHKVYKTLLFIKSLPWLPVHTLNKQTSPCRCPNRQSSETLTCRESVSRRGHSIRPTVLWPHILSKDRQWQWLSWSGQMWLQREKEILRREREPSGVRTQRRWGRLSTVTQQPDQWCSPSQAMQEVLWVVF